MQAHFEADIVIDRPIEEVYTLISHPEQIVGLQPLIQSVEILEEGQDEAGCQRYRFVAFEHMRLMGIFPIINRIETEMTLVNPPYELHQVGRTSGGIVLQQTISLVDVDDQTQVTNAIDYEAPQILMPYVRRELTRAHTAWLTILRARAEG